MRAGLAKRGSAVTRIVREFDPGAAEFIEAHRAALQPLFHEGTLAEFEKTVNSYAFSEAQLQLDQALKQFHSSDQP